MTAVCMMGAMATVERRQQGDGPVRYRVRWRDDAGKQKSKTFARRRDADQWRTKVEHDVLSGTYIDPSAGRVTLRMYAEMWVERQVWAPSTRASASQALRYVLADLGARSIGSIAPTDVKAAYASLHKQLAATTATVYGGYLAAILAAAHQDRVIPVDPARGIKRSRPARPQVVPPTAEQVALLLEHCPPQHRALLTTLIGLGLRIGEATGLTVDRVDFLGRTVRIDRQAQAVTGQGVQLTDRLKTDASYRTIPLPQSVALSMASHIERHGTGDEGVIFAGPTGRPVNRATARAAMHAAATAANEAARQRDRRAPAPFPVMFHPHDLRHFYASALIASGCSVKTVQARLGDASAAITLDVYGHLWPDNEEQTRDAVDAILAPVVASLWPEALDG